eukprot:1157224-Pelagomonas_calceolata.AAC.17
MIPQSIWEPGGWWHQENPGALTAPLGGAQQQHRAAADPGAAHSTCLPPSAMLHACQANFFGLLHWKNNGVQLWLQTAECQKAGQRGQVQSIKAPNLGGQTPPTGAPCNLQYIYPNTMFQQKAVAVCPALLG